MSFEGECYACVAGNHARHDPEFGITPGAIGGVRCACNGDCERRRAAEAERFAEFLGLPLRAKI